MPRGRKPMPDAMRLVKYSKPFSHIYTVKTEGVSNAKRSKADA